MLVETKTNQIKQIIAQRLPLGEKISQVETNLKLLNNKLQQLENYRQQILLKTTDVKLSSYLETIDYLTPQQKLETEIGILNQLKARFQRQTLNLGVIGRAGQGKSRLLQSLSGLTNTEIPTGDRHHENWGFISQKKANETILYLAPTYDHASCLGRELSDQKRASRSIKAYAQKCLSAFYRNIDDQKPLKTFDLFYDVAKLYPDIIEIWLSYLENISTEQIDLIIQSFPPGRLSPKAAEFAKSILLFNQERLLLLKK